MYDFTEYRGYHDCRYTVYDNRTGFPVIIDGNYIDAAEAMGIKLSYFRKAVYLSRRGLNKRWTILTSRQSDIDLEEED